MLVIPGDFTNVKRNVQLRAEALQYTPDLGVKVPFAGTSPSPPGRRLNGQSLKITERLGFQMIEQPKRKEDKRRTQFKHRKVTKPLPQDIYRNILAPTLGSRELKTPKDDHKNYGRTTEHRSNHKESDEDHVDPDRRNHQCQQAFPACIRPHRYSASQVFNHSALQVLDHQASQLFVHSASRVLGHSAFQVFNRLASLPFGLIDFELLGHGQPITSTRRFSRNSWVTDGQSRLLGGSPGTPRPQRNSWATGDQSRLLGGSLGTPRPRTVNFVNWEVLQELLDGQSRLLGGSPGTPGPRTVNFVYWEVLQELLGHGQPITSTGRFSRNSWATDGQSRLLGGYPGTPGPRTVNFVYWEVLQELLGHGQPITSTRKFFRNSWVTNNQSCLLGGSLGTPGPRTVNFVYWEVLQELLGHGRPILSTGRFSRNSWATDNRSCLLGDSQGTPGPRTTNLVYWEILQEPRTTVLVYWEILKELLGHGQPFMPTRSAFCRYLPLSTGKATERSKFKDHRTVRISDDRATQEERRQAENPVQEASESDKTTSASLKELVFDDGKKKMHFLLSALNVAYVLSSPQPKESETETLEEQRNKNKWENNDYVYRGHILNRYGRRRCYTRYKG
ncbi:hypothetical protein V8G54_009250 [Vigna mungo]|uniref:Uncharacterized protein n=1 Tax=Vigna mungo TaxID=3915 RepID=A0AAQ3NXN8_VIGMU